MEERRKHTRFNLSHKIIYQELSNKPSPDKKTTTETNSTATALSCDVSRGGVRLRTDHPITIGKTLKLKIFNSSYPDPIEAEAQVVWCKRISDDSLDVGLTFTRIGWIESDKLFNPTVKAMAA